MSIASSKQSPRYGLNIDLIFALFALTLVLFVLVPSDVNIYNSIRTAPGSLEIARAGVFISGEISFTADQKYWAANCGHGWLSDARCDFITVRTQSCSISLASAYCAEYKRYLQEHIGR